LILAYILKDLDDLDKIISEDDEALNTALELYQPKCKILERKKK